MQSMPAFYIGEHIALDFLNSVCAPSGERIEWLDDGKGLLRWMRDAGVISAEMAVRFEGGVTPGDLDRMAVQARALREAFRSIVSRLEAGTGESICDADFASINSWLHVALPAGILGIDTAGRTVRADVWSEVEANQIMRLLADVLADFLVQANMARLRQCEGPKCTLYFLDLTKNRSRRWCSMAVCGNRAKAARFRSQKN